MPEQLYVEELKNAFSLLQGAGRIWTTAKDQPIERIGVPFHLLIGFAVELNLKAYLSFKQVDWPRREAHNLSLLLSSCEQSGLELSAPVVDFIRGFSQYHKEHWFRYPHRAGVARTANVNDPQVTLALVRALYDNVFNNTRSIDQS